MRHGAVGGGNEETIEEAVERGPREQLRSRNRAVTAEDFETLTLEASTGIARAKTLPLYDPGNPTVETPGVVSVIAMPAGSGVLSEAMRDAIRTYLDERRLVTTRIFVVDPDYVTVTVEATVAKTPDANAAELKDKTEAALAEFINPEHGGDTARAAAYVEGVSEDRGPGWRFGRPVYLSELFELLERVNGVDHVEAITLPTGAVILERTQLPVSGTHDVTVV